MSEKTLNYPDLKYSVAHTGVCAECGEQLVIGEPVFRHTADNPDAWRHVKHGPAAPAPAQETER